MQQCNIVELSCICIRKKGHKGNHQCECGGAWYFNKRGEFRIGKLPEIEKGFGAFPRSSEQLRIIKQNLRDPQDTKLNNPRPPHLNFRSKWEVLGGKGDGGGQKPMRIKMFNKKSKQLSQDLFDLWNVVFELKRKLKFFERDNAYLQQLLDNQDNPSRQQIILAQRLEFLETFHNRKL